MQRESPGTTSSVAGIAPSPTFKLKDFEGPLDVLLFLIKKNEVNIYDIPIAEVTEQYCTLLRASPERNLDDLTEFSLMAATLLHLKSKMLLPQEFALTDTPEDPRKELVAKLIEYQKFKKIAQLLEKKEEEEAWYLERKKVQPLFPFAEGEGFKQMDIQDLVKTFSALLEPLSQEYRLDLFEEVSINEKVTLLNEYLETREFCYFTDLLMKKGSLQEVICAFIAVLEVVKSRKALLRQSEVFGTIMLYPVPTR